MKNQNEIEKEFNLSEKITTLEQLDNDNIIFIKAYGKRENPYLIMSGDVKEFIKRLLTPNNISKGFVEVSTIKYYAGDKLI